MSTSMTPVASTPVASWWAEGLVFENCNCRLVTHCQRPLAAAQPPGACLGYRAFRFDRGAWGGVALGGLNAVLVHDASASPQRPGAAGLVLFLDGATLRPQETALASILAERAGLGLPRSAAPDVPPLTVRRARIHLADEGRRKRAHIPGHLRSSVVALRGADDDEEVRLENSRNRLHGRSQVLALGTTHFREGARHFVIEAGHAAYSRFFWVGP